MESYPSIPGPEAFPEQGERSHESIPQAPGETLQAPPALPVLPAPDPVAATVPAPLSPVPVDHTIPTAANDDDLIEKEWVDKAKQVITMTKDDPYKREVEVSRLQREYIRKRYGREIGDSGDQI